MSTTTSIPNRRFYRSTDNAVLGGVCAGMAEYFGFNLRVTRILAIIAFFMAMPMAVFSYLAIVFLVPARSTAGNGERGRSDFRKAVRSTPRQTMSDVRSRFHSLDRRLARLEKYVTSSRYTLDREFRDLEQH